MEENLKHFLYFHGPEIRVLGLHNSEIVKIIILTVCILWLSRSVYWSIYGEIKIVMIFFFLRWPSQLHSRTWTTGSHTQWGYASPFDKEITYYWLWYAKEQKPFFTRYGVFVLRRVGYHYIVYLVLRKW